MRIEKEIFKGIRNVGKRKVVKVDLYPYVSELYKMLEENNLIQELKDTALLGNICIKKRDSYSRFDYVMMQLYIYQFVKKHLSELEISLNNKFKCKEFRSMTMTINDKDFPKPPTIADVLQVLSFIYNIGHFRSTFTSSRAALNLINNRNEIGKSFLSSFKYEIHKQIAKDIIESNNYLRFHLLNSLLLLQNLDEDNLVVKFSINILTEYLTPSSQQSPKAQYTFELFRIIREICYVTLDLSIAPVPIYLDIYNDKYLKTLLEERLSGYNDQRQIKNLFNALNKLLQDTVYNEECNAIIQYDIARRMTNNVLKSDYLIDSMMHNYYDFIKAQNNQFDVFNRKYFRLNDFDNNNILKLSFDKKEQRTLEELVDKLNSTNFVKAAWYYRKNENKITILVSIKKNCTDKTKVGLKIARLILNVINKLQIKENAESYHSQSLLTIKFLLYYLFANNRVILEGRLDPSVCVILDRGKNGRVKSLNMLISDSQNINEDDVHEIEVLRDILLDETKNDLCLTVCSSILVTENKVSSEPIAEFDGLILFPNRIEKQVIFVESKNRKEQPSHSKNCLIDKFESLGIRYSEEDICIFNKDCKYYYSI